MKTLDSNHPTTRAGDRTVSALEFEQGLNSLGVTVSPDEAMRLVRRFGSDGRVRFFEFVKMMNEAVDLEG